MHRTTLVEENIDLVKSMPHAIAQKIRSYHLIDEYESICAQALWESACSYDENLAAPGGFRPYAARRMQNRCIDFLRIWAGQTRRGANGLKPEAAPSFENDTLNFSPDTQLDFDIMTSFIKLLKKLKLTEKESDCILNDLRGETLDHVAQRWNITESRACQIKTRIKKRLKYNQEFLAILAG